MGVRSGKGRLVDTGKVEIPRILVKHFSRSIDAIEELWILDMELRRVDADNGS